MLSAVPGRWRWKLRPTEPIIRVLHSVPDADALTEVLASNYTLPAAPRTWFYRRGLTDVYMVDSGGGSYVLRVYRHGWRTDSDLRWEADLLAHLRRRGVRVSGYVPTSAGEQFTAVRAPEGRRQLMLLTFAAGRELREGRSKGSKPSVSEYAEAYGALAAGIHRAADGFRTPHQRFALDVEHLLRRPLRAADPLLAARPADRDWLHETVDLLQARIADLAGTLDWGPCHGDLTGGNAVVADGELTMFDFDSGAPGWRAYDLGVFAWSTRLQQRPQIDVARFLAGYESVRPLPAADRAALPLFAAVREVWFIGLQTENAPVWGYGLADDDFLTQRLRLLRELVEALGE